MKQDTYKIVGVVILSLLGLGVFFSLNYLLYVALGLGVLAYSSEWFASRFAQAWMQLGKWLGRINGTIILSVFFILILLPLSLLKRLFTKNGNNLTNWIKADSDINFEKPW